MELNVNATFPVAFRCGVGPSIPPSLIPGIRAIEGVQAFIALVSAVLAVLTNGFVIFLIVKFKALHQRAFIIALQLLATGFVFGAIVLVVVTVTAIRGEWLLGATGCKIMAMLHDGYATQHFFIILLLTLDRVFSVFLPFFYDKHGGKVSFSMMIILWAVNLTRVFVPLGLDCYEYLPSFKMCTALSSCSRACYVFTLTAVGVTAVTGGPACFVLYVSLFCKSLHLRRTTQSTLPSQSQSQRATRTMLLLFIALVCCTLPPTVLYMVQFALGGFHPTLIAIQILVGRTCFNGLSVVDPIIIMRNRDIREVLKDVRTYLADLWRSRTSDHEQHVTFRQSVNRRRNSCSTQLTVTVSQEDGACRSE